METNKDIINSEILSLLDKFDWSLFNNKTILITGCNGLIGGYLLNFFYKLSNIYNINIICTSFSSSLSESIFDKSLIKRVNYFSWDASTPIDKDMVKINDVDYVYYCSGYAQPAKFIKEPIKTSLINTLGLYSILSGMKNDATFTYMSSSEIYGDPNIENIPTKESYNGNYSISSNRACYIISKRLGEALCLSESNRLKIKICRISLTYGPGTTYYDERVIQQFIRKANEQKEINLLDNGLAVRTFCYISDSVEMILNISLKGKELVYNVASNIDSITILELAQLIAKLLDAKVSVKEIKDELISKNSPIVVRMDIDRYVREFGKNSFIDNKAGLNNIMKYYNLLA